MKDLIDRINLGIDSAQLEVAERTARALTIRRSAPQVGAVAIADPDRVARLSSQYARRRESLLTNCDFTAVSSATREDGKRLFIVPDHGVLLAPTFQFALNPEATDILQETTEALLRAYDPWSTWSALVGDYQELGGSSPESILCDPKSTNDRLAAVKETLLELLPE